jgi:hypothetical protein
MARANLNNQAKRKRELAKKDKRAAKDQKRAERKAEAREARAGVAGKSPPATSPKVAVAQPTAASNVKSLAAARFIRRMNKAPGA